MAVEKLAPKARYRVLVVDDDPLGLETIEAALSADVDVVTAASPQAALAVAGSELHVVCADYQMPGMNGLELLRRASEQFPHLGCVLITGSNEYLRGHHGEGHFYVLVKPVDPERLIRIVTQLARVADMKKASSAPRSGPR